MAVADFLQEKRKEIDERLKELAPLVAEYERLEKAVSALDGIPAASPNEAPFAAPRPSARGRRPGRPRGSKSATKATPSASKARTAGKRTRGRRKGSGKRSSEALTIIQEQPGVTIPEIASKMGIKQNYLYRILPGLEGEGKVGKQGRGWHPKIAA
ncbi:MAG TPA: hypothetical protein VGL57_13210 [Solirubrobacteraceae bacterium]